MGDQKIICFGELLLRLGCPGFGRFTESTRMELRYGGSEANVAILLARLGLPAEFVTRLPPNDLGDAAEALLRSQGVGTGQIQRGGERLGLYFSENGNAVRPTRILYDRAHSAFASLEPGMIPWKKIFSQPGWFQWSGISPALSSGSVSVCLEALEQAAEAGMHISADFNHRTTLWNYGRTPAAVMPELLAYCESVTCDLDSAGVYFGIRVPDAGDLRKSAAQCMESLSQKLPRLKTLAMSIREPIAGGGFAYSGALMHSGKMYFQDPYPIHDGVGRIGSGDAFTGGLLYGLVTGAPPEQTLGFAVAAGALKHGIEADFPLFSLAELQALIRDGSGRGRVVR